MDIWGRFTYLDIWSRKHLIWYISLHQLPKVIESQLEVYRCGRTIEIGKSKKFHNILVHLTCIFDHFEQSIKIMPQIHKLLIFIDTPHAYATQQALDDPGKLMIKVIVILQYTSNCIQIFKNHSSTEKT